MDGTGSLHFSGWGMGRDGTGCGLGQTLLPLRNALIIIISIIIKYGLDRIHWTIYGLRLHWLHAYLIARE